jgi:hypothetical protein
MLSDEDIERAGEMRLANSAINLFAGAEVYVEDILEADVCFIEETVVACDFDRFSWARSAVISKSGADNVESLFFADYCCN